MGWPPPGAIILSILGRWSQLVAGAGHLPEKENFGLADLTGLAMTLLPLPGKYLPLAATARKIVFALGLPVCEYWAPA